MTHQNPWELIKQMKHQILDLEMETEELSASLAVTDHMMGHLRDEIDGLKRMMGVVDEDDYDPDEDEQDEPMPVPVVVRKSSKKKSD